MKYNINFIEQNYLSKIFNLSKISEVLEYVKRFSFGLYIYRLREGKVRFSEKYINPC